MPGPENPAGLEIPEGFTETKGRIPKTGDAALTVMFRCGYIDYRNTYVAKQLRWSDTGGKWDVVAVKRL